MTECIHRLTRLAYVAYVIWARESNVTACILERMRAHKTGCL